MQAMIRNLDMALIRTFVTVADKASMTAAANALHLTQGAVSQQVKRLEEALGSSMRLPLSVSTRFKFCFCISFSQNRCAVLGDMHRRTPPS